MTRNMNTENQTIRQKQNEELLSKKKTSSTKKNKGTQLTIKGLLIGLLIILLLIPAHLISNLIKERLKREETVRNEVCSKWATEQTLIGPILVIPYLEQIVNDKNEITAHKRIPFYFLPEMLDISGEIIPFNRHRSIFEIMVYRSEMNFKGNFSTIDLKSLGVPPENFLLNEAYIYFYLNDFRGIEKQIKINWDNKDISLGNELTSINKSAYSGLVAPLPDLTIEDLLRSHPFSMDIKIKGSESLNFVPIGKTSTTHLFSKYPNPSFDGNFLPNEPAKISEDGFKADWEIFHLNRSFPQYWSGNFLDFSDSVYGVKLLTSTDSYTKTERSVKYAILFIALTFALYFFIEIIQNKKVHPIQYVLVGMALCIFYTLLLSISEYINFNWAYLIAASATIILIFFYTKSAFGKWITAFITAIILGGLYSFIFILIQLQDGALLFGSIGLFILLAVIMFYSRKIDWYGQLQDK